MIIKRLDPRLTKRIAILIGGLLAVYYVGSHVGVVFTDSVKATVVWRTTGIPQKGDYAMYTLDVRPYKYLKSDLVKGDSIIVTKRVVCTAGDTLIEKDRHFLCNGEHVAVAKTTSTQGKPLTPFAWNGPIPAGKVFLLGEHLDSFDSRYWGFADQSATQRAVRII